MARWTDVPGAAEHLHTSVRHIRRFVYERTIPFHKLGGKVRFDLDELDAWMKNADGRSQASSSASPASKPVVGIGRGDLYGGDTAA